MTMTYSEKQSGQDRKTGSEITPTEPEVDYEGTER